MAKKTNKKDAPLPMENVLIDNLLCDNSTTENADMSSDLDDKGRHFWFVVYPTEQYVNDNFPNHTYDGTSGWGTAPDNWIELLQNTGLAFHVSPLHYLDINPDNTPKKPHWHVIVSWGNTTTYRSALGIADMLKSPRPQILKNPVGAYRYAKHLDNPEKFQYPEDGKAYNGWQVPLDNSEVTRIKREIKDLVFIEDIREYAELLIVCSEKGPEYEDVATNNTFYCERLCASYRHNPVRVLMRYFNTLPDGDLKNEIEERINSYSERRQNYESSN